MKDIIKMIGSAVAVFLICGLSFVFANQTINAMQNTEIKVSLDGINQVLKDETTGEVQYPITYRNRTYMPLRTIANNWGIDVNYNEKENSVEMFSFGYEEDEDFDVNEEDLIGLWDIVNYSMNYDFDGGRITSKKDAYYFEFFNDNEVVFNDGEELSFVGQYIVSKNTHNDSYEVKMSFENFEIKATFESKNKFKIYSLPKTIMIDDKELEIKIIGKIFEKDTAERQEAISKLNGGMWRLEDIYMPKWKSNIHNFIQIKNDQISYADTKSYSVSGGYSVHGDIIDVYFNTYEGTVALSQDIAEQHVRFRINDNKLVVLQESTRDITYLNNSDSKKIEICNRILDLTMGMKFDKE